MTQTVLKESYHILERFEYKFKCIHILPSGINCGLEFTIFTYYEDKWDNKAITTSRGRAMREYEVNCPECNGNTVVLLRKTVIESIPGAKGCFSRIRKCDMRILPSTDPIAIVPTE